MTTESYLDEAAGGTVIGAAFYSEESAAEAVKLLREAGVRSQDISVVARDRARARRIAGDQAWLPGKAWNGLLPRLLARIRGDLPRELVSRYRRGLDGGMVVVVAAADGQPADTIAALLSQAQGTDVDQWFQPPARLFAPPELAGPF